MTRATLVGTLLLVGLLSPTIVEATVDPLVADLALQFQWHPPDLPIHDLASFALRTANSLLEQGSDLMTRPTPIKKERARMGLQTRRRIGDASAICQRSTSRRRRVWGSRRCIGDAASNARNA
eukprot:6683171-Pyramimonas_sp.AAC.1